MRTGYLMAGLLSVGAVLLIMWLRDAPSLESVSAKRAYTANKIGGVSKAAFIPPMPERRADSLIAFAKQYLGTQYKYGSCTPDGFDCSGFVYFVFNEFGYRIPRSSFTIAKIGTDVSKENAHKGDLIFFRGTNPADTTIGHIGIIITETGEPIRFIHSSSNGGVKITAFEDSSYPIRFVKIKRVDDRL